MVSPTIVFIAGMIIVLLLVVAAGFFVWNTRTESGRFRTEMALAGFCAGALAAVIFGVTIGYISPPGPPDPMDLCPAGTFNQYPQGPALCVEKGFWGD